MCDMGLQVQGGPNSFQVQYQVTRQDLQQLSEMKARQAVIPPSATLPFPPQSVLLQNTPLAELGKGMVHLTIPSKILVRFIMRVSL